MMDECDLRPPVKARPDKEHFPEAVPIENRALPLHYAYKPGKVDDGVTLTVNIRQVASLTEADVDWAVPGHLAEKIEHCLRSLPKEQRRAFVPVAETARLLAAELAQRRKAGRARGTFLHELESLVRETRGAAVDAAAWSAKPLPDPIRVRIQVVDDRGKELASGRELSEVLTALEVGERAGAAQIPKTDPEAWARARTRVERGAQQTWAFGDVPERVVVTEKAGVFVYAYPALRAEEKGVALRLFATAEEAQESGRQGLFVLLSQELRNDLAWLHRDLKAIGTLGAALAMLGTADELREDAYGCILQWACGRQVRPLGEAAFREAAARARADLKGLVPRFVELVREIAGLRQELLVEKRPYPGMAEDAARLVPPRFLRVTPYAQLQHLPRYLKAMRLRSERRRQNPSRDDERARELAPYLAAAEKRGSAFRWLVEEYRVSLFAQELGTAVPVSKVKLDRALAGEEESPRAEEPARSPPAPLVTPASGGKAPAKLKNLRSLDALFPRPGG